MTLPEGVHGGLEVPLARWAWYYHAHLVLTVVRIALSSPVWHRLVKKAFVEPASAGDSFNLQ